MALTLTAFRNPNRSKLSNKLVTYWTLAFDSSYPTGGEAITAAEVGLTTIDQIIFSGDQAGYQFGYIPSTGKIIGYSTAATEIGNGTNLSAVTGVHIMAIGT